MILVFLDANNADSGVKAFIKVCNNECINNLKLLLGAKIVEEIRQEIFKDTGFRCSAGISHNKVMNFPIYTFCFQKKIYRLWRS